MKNFLLPKKEDTRYKKIQIVLFQILLANFAVAGLKIVVGTLIQSASMTADGFHSISDGTSNIIGMVGIYVAGKPRDKCHPYGHSKFETMTGMIIGIMLVAVGINVIFKAILWFQNPLVPKVGTAGFVAMIVTLLVNIAVTTYEKKKGKELNSQILISDAMHTRSDIYVSVGVLIVLIAVKLGAPAIIDPIASLVVALFIFHAAYEVFKENINVLTDHAVIEESICEKIAKSYPEIKNIHNIRSRGSLSNMYIDMHVWVDPSMTVEESHALEHRLEAQLREEINESIQLGLHLEPAQDGEELKGIC